MSIFNLYEINSLKRLGFATLLENSYYYFLT
jgi:hypothetical protein